MRSVAHPLAWEKFYVVNLGLLSGKEGGNLSLRGVIAGITGTYRAPEVKTEIGPGFSGAAEDIDVVLVAQTVSRLHTVAVDLHLAADLSPMAGDLGVGDDLQLVLIAEFLRPDRLSNGLTVLLEVEREFIAEVVVRLDKHIVKDVGPVDNLGGVFQVPGAPPGRPHHLHAETSDIVGHRLEHGDLRMGADGGKRVIDLFNTHVEAFYAGLEGGLATKGHHHVIHEVGHPPSDFGVDGGRVGNHVLQAHRGGADPDLFPVHIVQAVGQLHSTVNIDLQIVGIRGARRIEVVLEVARGHHELGGAAKALQLGVRVAVLRHDAVFVPAEISCVQERCSDCHLNTS